MRSESFKGASQRVNGFQNRVMHPTYVPTP